MKKLTALVLVLVLLLSFAGCGGSSELKQAAAEISRLTGQTITADDVQQMLDEYAAVGLEMTPTELVDLVRLGTELAGDSGSGGIPSPAGTTTAGAGSYETAYTFYSGIIDAISTTVSNAVEANNAALEEQDPEGYYNNPQYRILFYMPFLSIDLALTSSLSDTVSEDIVAMTFAFFGVEDLKFSVTAPGRYRLSYTGSDWDDNPYAVEMLACYDVATNSMRFVEYHDGVVSEFCEFVGLGNDRYALQNRTDRAVVTYRDGVITELVHSVAKYNTDSDGNVVEGSFWYDEESDSIFGKSGLDRAWVLEGQSSDGIVSVYEIAAGQLTINSQNSTTDWDTGEVSYTPADPITIPLA